MLRMMVIVMMTLMMTVMLMMTMMMMMMVMVTMTMNDDGDDVVDVVEEDGDVEAEGQSQDQRNTLRELRSRNARTFRKSFFVWKFRREMPDSNPVASIARACAVEMHMDMSEEP